MKKILTLITGLACVAALHSQAPSKFSYQAVVRNSSGTVVPNGTNVNFRFTIRDGSTSGSVLYQETQAKTTNNNFGLVNLEIGAGTLQQGAYPTAAQWASGLKFLQVEIDPAGGTAFSDLGASQLTSVPYANFAGASATSAGLTGTVQPSQLTADGATSGQVLSWNGSNWVPVTPTDGDITSVTAGTGLSGGGASGSVTLNATNSTAMWNASSLQGIALNSTAPTTGQVLKYDGTKWSPSADDNNTYTAGTGLSLSGSTFNSVWTVTGNHISKNNSGGVGIGIASPTNSMLHLDGGSSNYAGLHFTNSNTGSTATDGALYGPYTTNSLDILMWNFEAGNIYLGTSGSPRLTIDKDGITTIDNKLNALETANIGSSNAKGYTLNVGNGTLGSIGVGPASNTLNMYEGGRLYFEEGLTLGSVCGINAHYNGSSNALTFYGLCPTGSSIFTMNRGGNVGLGDTTPSYQLELSQNSAAKPTSSAWTVPSDRRLKDEVGSFNDGLNVVMAIRPVMFKYNGKLGLPTEEVGIGTIAQELKEIAPYMVKTTIEQSSQKIGDIDYNGNTVMPGDPTEYLCVDYGAMNFVLINAIKEQQAQIDALKKEIEALKAAQK